MREIVEVLCAISEVSARLAKNLLKREEKNDNGRYGYKAQNSRPVN